MKEAVESVDTLNLRLRYISQCQKDELKKPRSQRSLDQLATLIFTKATLKLQKADLLFDQGQFKDAHKWYKMTVKNIEEVIGLKSKTQSSFMRTVRKKLKKNSVHAQISDELMYLHELAGSIIFYNIADNYFPENLNNSQQKKIRIASEHFDDAMAANQERGIVRVDLKHCRADAKAMRVGVQGRYHIQAVNLYNQVLDETNDISKSLSALYSKGLSLYRLGKRETKRQYEGNATPGMYASARECFEHVVKINDKHIHAINGIGNLEVLGKDPRIAQEFFVRACAIDNQYAPALYNQGKCLQLLGSYQKAINLFLQSSQANHSNNTVIIRSAKQLAAELSEELMQWREIGINTDSHEARNAVHQILNMKISKRLRKQVIGRTEHQERVPDGDGGYKTITVIDDPIGHAMKKSAHTLRDMFILLTNDLDGKDRSNGNTYVIRFMKNLGLTNRHEYFNALNQLITQCECGAAGYILDIIKREKPLIDVCGHDYLNVTKRPNISLGKPDLIEFNADFESADLSSIHAPEYSNDSELADDESPEDSANSVLSVSSPVSVKSSSSIQKPRMRDILDVNNNNNDTVSDGEDGQVVTADDRRAQYQRSPRFFSQASQFNLSVTTHGDTRHRVRIDIEASNGRPNNNHAEDSDSSDVVDTDTKPFKRF